MGNIKKESHKQTTKHITGEFPIKSTWPKAWRFKVSFKKILELSWENWVLFWVRTRGRYVCSSCWLNNIIEVAPIDPVVKVREFHKKYSRISTPPDKKKMAENIYSNRTARSSVEKVSSIHEYIQSKKQKILETMGNQAKRRASILTMNTITEFGERPIHLHPNSRRDGNKTIKM